MYLPVSWRFVCLSAADWSWDEVIQFVTENQVPYNKGHHFAYRAA